MKEFDLEKAKDGAPVCTRNGRKARIICFDAKYKDTPLVVLLEGSEEDDCEEDWQLYHEDGRCISEYECSDDLMMAPVKHEGWINIYGRPFRTNGTIYDTEKKAKKHSGGITDDRYIATIKIEWEE